MMSLTASYAKGLVTSGFLSLACAHVWPVGSSRRRRRPPGSGAERHGSKWSVSLDERPCPTTSN
jgi:hypothetical protein